MKVTGIRVRYYEYTMKRPIGDVNGPLGNDKGSSALTFVDTDEGITGVSLAGNGAVRNLEHLIVGEDPRGVVGLWKKMQDFVFKGGNEGQNKAAIAAIDCALRSSIRAASPASRSTPGSRTATSIAARRPAGASRSTRRS